MAAVPKQQFCTPKGAPGPSTSGRSESFRVRSSVVRASPRVESRPVVSDLVKGASVEFKDPPAFMLRRRALIAWEDHMPKSVLIVKKPHSSEASAKLQEIGAWCKSQGLVVYVEEPVHQHEFKEYLSIGNPRLSINREPVDFCITLGGDGTVLHLASLFQDDQPLPPVISFAMGTLGFLTAFDAADFQTPLARVLAANQEPLFCTLRTRKRCEVYHGHHLQHIHNVLNECVIDRGASPSLVQLECFIDDEYVTTVQADGLIIATPSGSTAYSMSAGGPMIAPSVPSTILTPIAPHSLAFRPLLVPESSPVVLHYPAYAKSHARASFDGRHTMRLLKDSTIVFSTSVCPLPLINLGRLDKDFYDGITNKLKWNQALTDAPEPQLDIMHRRRQE